MNFNRALSVIEVFIVFTFMIIAGSLITIGALVNIFIIGWITDLIGKKKCLILLCIPNLIFWCLVFFSTNVYHLYAARFIAGTKFLEFMNFIVEF